MTLITDRIQPPHHTVPSHIRHLRSSRFLAEAHDESSSIQSRSGENGAANLAPYFFPDGKRIIFASNMADPKSGRDFDLYVVNLDGTGLERVTFYPDFDSFPMFTSDGKKLVWVSNRNGTAPHETNIFIADWAD